MGFAKRKMIEEQERGWSSLGDKCVCDKCLNDYALERFIKENASSLVCDYCGRKSKRRPIAAPIDDVVEIINEGVLTEWGDPNEQLPYDSREGGYQGTVLDSWDLFGDELGDYFNNDTLREEIIDAYSSRSFCQRDYFALTESDALRFGWREFCNVVKHKTRFLFVVERDEHNYLRSHDEITPSSFLDHLGEVLTNSGVVRRLAADTRFHRVRVHKLSESLSTAKDLGPPPIQHARFANRMSPAGIPLFYGALDRKVAVKETYDPEQDSKVRITAGEFLIARPFPVCDFTNLPPIPSLFDTIKRHTRHALMFLHDFVTDLSRPIKKDGREHIEYVPTQVVTEYLRRVYSHPDLGAVQGIIYRSAQQQSGACCALFFDSDDCTDVHPAWADETKTGDYRWWLGLDSGSVVTSRPPKTNQPSQNGGGT